jgi:uncharacterized protein YceK
MKIISIIVLICALVLSGCATTKTQSEQEIVKVQQTETVPERQLSERNQCAFFGDDAPDWVCKESLIKSALVGVGSYKMTDNMSTYFAKSIAQASATADIARKIRVKVNAEVRAFEQATGGLSNPQRDAVNRVLTNSLTSEELTGIRVIDMWKSDRNELFVLVGFDAELAKGQVRQARQATVSLLEKMRQNAVAKDAFETMYTRIEQQLNQDKKIVEDIIKG